MGLEKHNPMSTKKKRNDNGVNIVSNYKFNLYDKWNVFKICQFFILYNFLHDNNRTWPLKQNKELCSFALERLIASTKSFVGFVFSNLP